MINKLCKKQTLQKLGLLCNWESYFNNHVDLKNLKIGKCKMSFDDEDVGARKLLCYEFQNEEQDSQKTK